MQLEGPSAVNVPDESLVMGASLFPDAGTPFPAGRGVQLLHLLKKPPAFLVLCYELGLEDCLRCRTLTSARHDAL